MQDRKMSIIHESDIKDREWEGNNFHLVQQPILSMVSSFTRFIDHTQRRTTVGRTPLEEWSARRRDLYLTTYNNHNRYSRPRRDSNPQSQQASGRRPTP